MSYTIACLFYFPPFAPSSPLAPFWVEINLKRKNGMKGRFLVNLKSSFSAVGKSVVWITALEEDFLTDTGGKEKQPQQDRTKTCQNKEISVSPQKGLLRSSMRE